MPDVSLAILHSDPEGRLYDQLVNYLPAINKIFAGIAVNANAGIYPPTLDVLAASGALIEERPPVSSDDLPLGASRRAVITLALQFQTPYVMYCDGDRILHWAEFYPDELAAVVSRLKDYDFTVLGRTPRAFQTHPRIQYDTESIINHVYTGISGRPWDITAAARGLSRQAVEAITTNCLEDSIGVDAAWPLFIQQSTSLSMGYIETEGLEFETGDRFADQIAEAGSYENWIARLDSEPHHWAQRLNLARIEVEAMFPYHTSTED
jgi:hypothetical protein